MGVVYKARQVQLGRLVALKIIQAGAAPDAEERRRFRIEAEAVARLRHPNIVRIYGVGEHEGRPFLVLEFVAGESLAQRQGGKPWPAADAARLVEDLARAIHEAHQQGIIHRDLKPANILLQKDEGGRMKDEKKQTGSDSSFILHPSSFVPKITDFGLAKFLDGATQGTRTGKVLGTPQYMAPEQAVGQNARVGPATDVYALGATLYELLTGRPPFQDPVVLVVLEQVLHAQPVPPRRLRSDVPRDLETICLKCLQKEPGKRFPTAQALAEDLRRWRQHEPIIARRPGWGERLLLWANRRPAAALAALLLVLLVAVGGVALGLWLETTRVKGEKKTPGDIPGYWVGTLKAGDQDIRLIVKFTGQADGSYAGTFHTDQGYKEQKIDVIRFEDASLYFEVKEIGGVYEGQLKEGGAELVGQWKQPGWLLALTLQRRAREPTFARPQDPKRPYPYREEEVAYENPKGRVKVAGTLTLPRGKGPFPAAVLVTGSRSPSISGLEPQDRDETMFGHKPFRVLADHLARRGIAVLRTDDRGVGGSTGLVETATPADFTEDVLAGVAFLKTRRQIDPARIGLIGRHSKGGIIAPLAAARSRDVAFLVLLGGSGLTGEENLHLLSDFLRRARGASKKARARQRRIDELLCRIAREHKDGGSAEKQFEEVWQKELARLVVEKRAPESKRELRAVLKELLSPWSRFYLSHDPQTALRKVPCPVLALLGTQDRQVPPRQNVPKIVQALLEGGNKDFTVKELPGLNHFLQTSPSGNPSEYREIEETLAPAALKRISGWIRKRFVGGEKAARVDGDTRS
jgi:fermentation-respiration switch protein FrsA (DUF1100 family)